MATNSQVLLKDRLTGTLKASAQIILTRVEAPAHDISKLVVKNIKTLIYFQLSIPFAWDFALNLAG